MCDRSERPSLPPGRQLLGLYIESLELIRELDFDVLVPWAATSGQPYLDVTSHADAQRRIDAILERVRRGEDR